jgi:hypothetical protein
VPDSNTSVGPVFGEHVNLGTYCLFQLEGEDNYASITVVEIKDQSPFIPEEEAGFYEGTSLAAGDGRTPMLYTLAASLMIALARINGTDVEDVGMWYNPVIEQHPDKFHEAIRVERDFTDIHEAAQSMYDSIIKRQYLDVL